MIVLGCITLFIFLMRFLVFNFRESPKFLLSKGHDIHAIDVIHSVAHFNKAPPPKLSYEDFKALDFEESQRTTGTSTTPILAREGDKRGNALIRLVKVSLRTAFGHLRGLFRSKIYSYMFIVLAVA